MHYPASAPINAGMRTDATSPTQNRTQDIIAMQRERMAANKGPDRDEGNPYHIHKNLTTGQQAHAQSVFLIMAEISSDQAMRFLQILQTHGHAQRIGDTVWILRSATQIEPLQAALSAPLTRQDRLFIVDSFANKTAWFNIGADMDARIKALWDLSHNF